MINFNGFDKLIKYYEFTQNALRQKNIFFVGGVVRDILLDLRKNHIEDIDVTLSADPNKLFQKIDKNAGSIFRTEKFGTITIIKRERSEESQKNSEEKIISFEITPFREEGAYSDSRHPDELKWTNSLILDSVRRDFTINALYYKWDRSEEGQKRSEEKISFDKKQVFDLSEEKLNEEKLIKVLKNSGYAIILGTDNKFPVVIVTEHNLIEKIVEEKIKFDYPADAFHIVLDPQNGIKDILNQKLRAVGNPADRIQEDALRIIRAIRFVSVLNQYEHINLDFEGKTWQAMKMYYFLLRKVAKERVIQEMKKVFKKGNAFGFVGLMDELNILKFYFPALRACKNNHQPTRYHPFDTYSHSLLTLYHLQQINSDYLVRFGMLYHDVGKPDQYYWASIKKDEKMQQELYKLDIVHPVIGSEYTKEDFSRLGFSKKEIEEISFYVRYHMWPGEILAMKENKQMVEIKKMLSSYGLERLENLCDITIGDRLGQYNPLQHSNIEEIKKLKEKIRQIYEQEGRITLKDLAVDGNDIVKILGAPGPKVGQILQELLQLVLENKLENRKEILIDYVKNHLLD